MKEHKFELLFAILVGARAFSFVFNKILLTGGMGVMNLTAIRFLFSTVLLVILFPKRMLRMNRATLLAGAAIGISFFIMIWVELSATKIADVSLVSTVEHASIILVPVINSLLTRKAPTRTTVIGALLAFLGIVSLGLKNGAMSGSIWLSLLAALLYAAVIIITDRVTTEKTDAIAVGVVQLGTIGILALVFSLLTEHFKMPRGSSEWLMMIFLIIVCTAFGFSLTPYAQSRIPVDRAGIICAVNPAVAALLGVIILHENMGFLGTAGLVLILLSIVLPYLPSGRKTDS